MAGDFFQYFDNPIISANETPNSPLKLELCMEFKLLMALL